MTLFEIIVLAIIQGITEFLPISSSAHLILPAALLGWTEQGLAFDVAVHVGSLLAVIIYFRHDVWHMAGDWLRTGFSRAPSPQGKLAWCVIIGTLPAVLIGFLLKDAIEVYARNALIIACTTIVFGLLLWYADKAARHTKELTVMRWPAALMIGLAQAIALIPGTSRSGITMTAALLLGFNRESAARFSFLLSIPVILGAGTLATYELVETKTAVDWSALLYGAGFSFVSAYLCIYLFLSWISRIGMLPFVLYRLALGAVLLWFVFA